MATTNFHLTGSHNDTNLIFNSNSASIAEREIPQQQESIVTTYSNMLVDYALDASLAITDSSVNRLTSIHGETGFEYVALNSVINISNGSDDAVTHPEVLNSIRRINDIYRNASEYMNNFVGIMSKSILYDFSEDKNNAVINAQIFPDYETSYKDNGPDGAWFFTGKVIWEKMNSDFSNGTGTAWEDFSLDDLSSTNFSATIDNFQYVSADQKINGKRLLDIYKMHESKVMKQYFIDFGKIWRFSYGGYANCFDAWNKVEPLDSYKVAHTVGDDAKYYITFNGLTIHSDNSVYQTPVYSNKNYKSSANNWYGSRAYDPPLQGYKLSGNVASVITPHYAATNMMWNLFNSSMTIYNDNSGLLATQIEFMNADVSGYFELAQQYGAQALITATLLDPSINNISGGICWCEVYPDAASYEAFSTDFGAVFEILSKDVSNNIDFSYTNYAELSDASMSVNFKKEIYLEKLYNYAKLYKDLSFSSAICANGPTLFNNSLANLPFEDSSVNFSFTIDTSSSVVASSGVSTTITSVGDKESLFHLKVKNVSFPKDGYHKQKNMNANQNGVINKVFSSNKIKTPRSS